MKISTQIKLVYSEKDKDALLQTIEMFNEVCNGISKVAFSIRVFNQFNIHKLVYRMVRDCYPLSAQLCIRAISKVADSYKIDHLIERKFNSYGAITYDSRVLSFDFNNQIVSINTINGRIKIPFVCGQRQLEQLKFQKGEADLVFRDGNFYLLTCCEIPEEKAKTSSEFLGIDRGVNNIAADSLGNIYSGNKVISVRKKYSNLRRKLQKVKTKSSKRKLARMRRKESRFAKHINHEISKKIVATAQRHNLGIAIENLKGIRKSTTVRKGNRYIRQSWSFYDLEQKIIYKAKLKGIEVTKVDPRNTSKECSACGHISKLNRKTQSLFLCQVCGHTDHADINASRNISRRAVVNWPIVGSVVVVNSCRSPSYKSLSL